jgi:hypothetical protein
MIYRMKLLPALASALLALPLSVMAADVTYRQDIKPFIKAQCAECHAGDAPTLADFKLDEEKYKKEKLGPRSDTYENLLMIIVYPDPGAFMRRLDDGTNTSDKKPGNMYKYLGETDAERNKALTMMKAWLGDGAWNLNRWDTRGDVPGVTKEQMGKLKLKY